MRVPPAPGLEEYPPGLVMKSTQDHPQIQKVEELYHEKGLSIRSLHSDELIQTRLWTRTPKSLISRDTCINISKHHDTPLDEAEQTELTVHRELR